MKRLALIISLLTPVCCGAFEQHIGDFAFNKGIFSTEKINEAVEKKVAVRTDVGIDEVVVKHFRVEVFDDDITSKNQRTMFAAIETHFIRTVEGPMVLNSATLQAVTLGADGRLFANPAVLIIDGKRDGADFKVMQSQTKTGAMPLRKFHNDLAPEIADNLHWLSGFLDSNPGRPPVAIEKSPTGKMVALAELVLDLVPLKIGDIFKTPGTLFEATLKKLATNTVKDLIGDLSLHWGSSEEIIDERAVRHRKVYGPAGQTIWAF